MNCQVFFYAVAQFNLSFEINSLSSFNFVEKDPFLCNGYMPENAL